SGTGRDKPRRGRFICGTRRQGGFPAARLRTEKSFSIEHESRVSHAAEFNPRPRSNSFGPPRRRAQRRTGKASPFHAKFGSEPARLSERSSRSCQGRSWKSHNSAQQFRREYDVCRLARHVASAADSKLLGEVGV